MHGGPAAGLDRGVQLHKLVAWKEGFSIKFSLPLWKPWGGSLPGEVVGEAVVLIVGLKHRLAEEVSGSLSKHDSPFSEVNRVEPKSPYSASEAASYLLLRAEHQTHDRDVQ